MAMALGFTAIPAEAAPPPPKVDYVALGDSYSAGTGAGSAYRPNGVSCWQSQRGYVDVVGKANRVDLAANAACHGAVLSTLSPTYDPVIYTPTVEQQLSRLIFTGKLSSGTELVSITAGANDLGFAFVLGVCSAATEQQCAGAISQAVSPTNLAQLTGGLVQTYAAIHAAAPNAKIAVMGYPLLFDPASPYAPIPVANQQLINQATLTVNATLAGAVTIANALYQVNAQYVDVTAGFAGHAVNSADPWLVLDTTKPTADYNFHPNVAGHTLGYAAALQGAVNLPQLARL
ncbi:MAG: hydrolase family protein [Pseudarthrobacter sp.]|nr:hydrolase family protein [Pseudarthrobacter sp.]